MACLLSREKQFWCLRADFNTAFLVFNNVAKKTRTRNAFPLAQVLCATLDFLRLPVSYASVPPILPHQEPPLADFALAFGPTGDEDEEDEGPFFTPRMAYSVMVSAAWIGDHANVYEDFAMSAIIPRVARKIMRRSASWRKAFQQCYFRIYHRLMKGLMPKPNCTGEEMALHTMLSYAQDDFEEDEDYLALPEYANDEKFSEARDVLFEDSDVLELFEDEDSDESSEDGAEDVAQPCSNRRLEFMQSDIGQGLFNFAHIHPDEWFKAFRLDELWRELGICS